MVRTITARTLVAYAAGLLATFNFLGALNLLHPTLPLFIVPVVVAFPPLRRRAETVTNTRLSTAAAAMLYLVFTAGANVLLLATL